MSPTTTNFISIWVCSVRFLFLLMLREYCANDWSEWCHYWCRCLQTRLLDYEG
jgi:hypothetical protein